MRCAAERVGTRVGTHSCVSVADLCRAGRSAWSLGGAGLTCEPATSCRAACSVRVCVNVSTYPWGVPAVYRRHKGRRTACQRNACQETPLPSQKYLLPAKKFVRWY
jgi:hypothetical protein